MIQRALIAGLTSTGVDVADLRVSPAGGHAARAEDAGASPPAVHVGRASSTPRSVRSAIYERPGNQLTAGAAEGDREELHAPGAAPRRRSARWGTTRTRRASGRATRRTSSTRSTSNAIRARRFRIVDRLRLLGGVVRRCRSSSGRSASRRSRRTASSPTEPIAGETLAQAVGHAKRLVTGDRRRPRRRLRPRRPSGSSSSTSRARRCRSSRRCCSSCGCSRARGAHGQGRRSRSPSTSQVDELVDGSRSRSSGRRTRSAS